MNRLLLILALSLPACRVSQVGACSSDTDCKKGRCDLSQRICVATDCVPACSAEQVCDSATVTCITAPIIELVTDGRAGLVAGGTTATVRATITEPAGPGVDPLSVQLLIDGQVIPGSVGANDAWTFLVPLTQPGSRTVEFQIRARDTAGHERILTGDPRAVIRVDRDAPQIAGIAIAPAPDFGMFYNGAGGPLTVTATITDAAGVDAATVCLRVTGETGACAHPGTAGASGVFSFRLPRSTTSDGSAPTDFTISADDALAAALGGSIKAEHQGKSDVQHVFFDNQPPSLSAALKVYKDAEPADAGVTYPAAVANTGYTGISFIYSDTVHVKGALTDPSGVAWASLRVDGIEVDGGTAVGLAQALPLSCIGATCTFAADVKLDDRAGGFHSGNGMFDAGVAQIPFGPLQIVVDARDNLAHGRSWAATLNATRLLWQAQLQNAPSGLAVHPDGDLIATTDGGTTSVYDITPDGRVRWTVDAGPIIGGPAVGAGDGGSAPIYFATKGRSVYGVAPDGGVLFRQDNLGIFTAAPAVASAGTFEQVVVPDISGTSQLWAVAQGRPPVSVNSDDIDGTSGPVVLNGGVYFGTASSVSRHDLPGDGTLGAAPATFFVGGPFHGLATDGTFIYAAQRGSGTQLLQLDQQLNLVWNRPVTNGVAAEPTVDAFGVLVSSLATNTAGGRLLRYDASGTAAPPLYTFAPGTSGRVPVQGSAGHTYLTRTAALLVALKGTQLSWEFDAPGEPFRGAAMDCQGRLYIAGGSAAAGFWVWAFVTDDRGLADTPWPSMRRDSRNTGNFGALKYGIRTSSGCQQ